MLGTKKELVDLLAAVQGWEALVNDNWALLRDMPVPIYSAATLAALETAMPAASNSEAVAIVADPFGIAISNGVSWILLPGPTSEELWVRNESGGTIAAGVVVEVAGLELSPSRPQIQVLSDYANRPLGVVRASIANNAEGVVIRRGFYTSTLNGSVGARVYAVKATGALQLLATAPTVAQVGTLITAGASGVVYVDIPRLSEQALPVYSTGEIDTGVNEQVGTSRIYRKVFTKVLGNNTTVTQAHGITALNLSAGAFLHARVSGGPAGGPVRIMPYHDATNQISVTVDGTNINIKSNFDATTWTAHIVLEYLRTG